MRSWVYTLVAVLIAELATAQIIDFDAFAAMDKEVPDSLKVDGSIAFNAAFQKQAQQINTYSGEASLATQYRNHLWLPVASQRITTTDNNELQNSGFLTLKYFNGFQRRVFSEGFLQYQWEAQRGMRQRYLYGGNLWLNIIRTEQFQWAAAVGGFSEYEQWDYTAVPTNKRPEAAQDFEENFFLKYNAKTRLVWKWREKSALSFTIYVQGRPDETEYIRVAPSCNLLLQIHKALYFSTGFEGIYDFQPIVPIDNFFFSQQNALIFRF